VDLDLDVDVDLDLFFELGPEPRAADNGAHVNYRKLDVYQLAVRFLPIAVQFAHSMPSGYRSFADQLRRASLSVPLNVAEGSGKTTAPDQRRFYAIARGSAMECGAIVDASPILGFIDAPTANRANELLDSVVRMLSKMARPDSD
jgi:four helix bundle protein